MLITSSKLGRLQVRVICRLGFRITHEDERKFYMRRD
jgi:hypothetical protein